MSNLGPPGTESRDFVASVAQRNNDLPAASDPTLVDSNLDSDGIALEDIPTHHSNQPPPPAVGLQRRDTALHRWTRRQTAKVREAGARRREGSNVYLGNDLDDITSQRRRSSTVDLEAVAHLLEHDQLVDTKSHGVSEVRDGWFDATFLKAKSVEYDHLMRNAESTLPSAFDRTPPMSVRHFFPKQRRQLESVFWKVVTTRSGLRLTRVFVAFFIAYVLCLVPQVREWLGRYNYIMVVSTVMNHPGRPFGAQLDGTVQTTLGTIAGLGWGALGLLLSTSTLSARVGYGGILALFLVTFIAVVASLRSYFTRFYQFSMCAGMAMCYTVLAEVNEGRMNWPKFWSYGVPWVLGQTICLIVNLCLFFDAGARPLAESLHTSLGFMQEALEIPRSRNRKLRRCLARASVDVGVAYRDLRIDVSITRFNPDDVRALRNLFQGAIRSLLLLKTESRLFDEAHVPRHNVIPVTITPVDMDAPQSPFSPEEINQLDAEMDVEAAVREVASHLAAPTEELLALQREALSCCDAALMNLSGYRHHLGPAPDVSADVNGVLVSLRDAMYVFDTAEQELEQSDKLLFKSGNLQEVAKLIVFAQHIRLSADSIDRLAEKVAEMQAKSKHQSFFQRFYLPSYPVGKAVNSVNKQVRRDRGGQTAGIYKETFREIWDLIDSIKSQEHTPVPQNAQNYDTKLTHEESTATMDAAHDPGTNLNGAKLRYKAWLFLHRLQGFETKYAVKVCLLTASLAIPAWLDDSRGWWNEIEAWWTVVMAWVMVHPRIGGNMQDIITRAFCATLGAVWAGVAYAAHDGNPFVMAAFATVYMIPMLYRFTQSSHPRSGIAGCLSFTVISLGLVTSGGGLHRSIAFVAATKGLAFLIGTLSAIFINWILWPFIARHELRKALSAMMFFQSVIYRTVVARYMYYEEEESPNEKDIERSEMIEGRLREGFVRIRQLLIMTRHEIRLRGAFDPLPYSAMADACERFFEHLIALRRAAMIYEPGHVRDNDAATHKLLPYRRDAVASILSNLYILSGALKSGRKVPRYLPSAAAARKRLLDRMIEVEGEVMASSPSSEEPEKNASKWAQVHGYAFNESLTGCVAQLEELERYTKLIVGEQGFDDEHRDTDSSSDEDSDDENEEDVKRS